MRSARQAAGLVGIVACALLAATLPVGGGLGLGLLEPTGGRGAIAAGGAFTCDFGLPADVPLETLPPVIERDRMYMAERPGMLHKHIPLIPDPASQQLLAGGRYLFTTQRQAEDYFRWVVHDFVLDGTHFFDRPYFLDPDCHAWGVVGAHEWGDIHHTVALRTERFAAPGNAAEALAAAWPVLRAAAHDRGLNAVWLLHEQREHLASLVYFADRALPGQDAIPGGASLAPLLALPPLGDSLVEQGFERVFDRTQIVVTIWFPFAAGDRGQASLWPNSPPLPQPYTDDGVCEVSQGEDSTNAAECLPTCGNAQADEGEDTWNCPGDVRPRWTRIP
ncbi:MAG TPA: hypothetical protein VGR28_03405 [Candidatus Thermoplasmatota archaeon]|nr:hypothetical protein [Candidatus Thermoplasmatota archaeon]